MATEEQIRQFFASKPNKPNKVKINGKFKFSDLPNDLQAKIKQRIASKDEVMAQGLKGELPGIKIDGKAITKDNIHEFEIQNKSKSELKVEPKIEIKKFEDMTKDELETYALKKFKVSVNKPINLDKRYSKDKLIKEIKKLEGQ